MNAIFDARNDGVTVSLTPTGKLELSGGREAVARWTPVFLKEKAGIVESFEERAAILEFDAGLSRNESERIARQDVLLEKAA